MKLVLSMSEEEMLRRKLLLEMQRKLLAKQVVKPTEKPDYISTFLSNLTEDGGEMYEKAAEQYPSIAPKIAEALGRLYAEGRLAGKLDAETVYGIFYEAGCPIRIEIKIVYKKKGEVKTISEMLKERE